MECMHSINTMKSMFFLNSCFEYCKMDCQWVLCGSGTDHKGVLLIVQESMFGCIVKVHDLTPYSIHSMISCNRKANVINMTNSISTTVPIHDLPPQFVWTSKSNELWKQALQHSDVKSEIDGFLISLCRDCNFLHP